MGSHHGHGETDIPRASRATTRTLAVLVALIVAATAIGAAAIWPTKASEADSVPVAADGSSWVHATVMSTPRADGTVRAAVEGATPYQRTMTLQPRMNVLPKIGDRVVAFEVTPGGDLYFWEYQRSSPMIVLLVLYLIAVIAVARWRGVGALLGLALAAGILIFFAVPSLFSGHSPLAVGMVSGSGALLILIYMAHGVNARATTAYLGTIGGLLLTGLIGAWAVSSSHLTGYWTEEGGQLELVDRHVSLPGLVLCGVILAGLGVLNDITVTQASAVWELRAAKPHAGRREIFARGMRIGRDHIASTVYTLAFAYVGAALPIIMLVSLYDSSLAMTMTSEDIAEEIVRTLVGSIGLVLAVPLTTLIAVFVAHTRQPDASQGVATEPRVIAPVAPTGSVATRR